MDVSTDTQFLQIRKDSEPFRRFAVFDALSENTLYTVFVQEIFKEGWDCRSLTGIILSQEGDCPKNMVLQTSCCCLRQVEKGMPETALIYLNDTNRDKLNARLQQQHHISLKEFQEASSDSKELKHYDRTKYLKLPKIDFYQLWVNYVTGIFNKVPGKASAV